MARKAATKKAEEVEDLELDDLEDDLEDDEVDDEEEAAPKRKRKTAAKKEDKPKGIGARQLAERLKADPKTFRAWLRRKQAAGEFEDPRIEDRETKSRYNFGEEWTDPLIVKIMEMWESESHERGAGLKKAQEAKAKKAPAKKTRKRSTKKASSDDDEDEDEDL